jgi:hypothetical protein
MRLRAEDVGLDAHVVHVVDLGPIHARLELPADAQVSAQQGREPLERAAAARLPVPGLEEPAADADHAAHERTRGLGGRERLGRRDRLARVEGRILVALGRRRGRGCGLGLLFRAGRRRRLGLPAREGGLVALGRGGGRGQREQCDCEREARAAQNAGGAVYHGGVLPSGVSTPSARSVFA